MLLQLGLVSAGVFFLVMSMLYLFFFFFFFSSRRRHTRSDRDWSSDVCSSDLLAALVGDVMDTSRIVAGTFTYRFGDVDLGALVRDSVATVALAQDERSEERRVGKECRSRWSPYH